MPEGEGDGDGFFATLLTNIRRPIVWGPALGVVLAAIITVAVIIRRKKARLDFDE
jgi:hypothetical protein